MSRLRPLSFRMRLALFTGSFAFMVLLAVIGAIGTTNTRLLEKKLSLDIEASAQEIAETVQAHHRRPGSFALDEARARRYTRAPGALLVIRSPERVLFSSAKDTRLDYLESTERTGILIVGSAPVSDNVRVQYAVPAEKDTLSSLWTVRAIGAFAGGILAMLGAYFLAGRMLLPLRSLTKASHRVAKGEGSSKDIPPPTVHDEIGELGLTLKEAFGALEAAERQALAHADQQKRFVADASHELRTPLASLRTNLELLQDEIGQQVEKADTRASLPPHLPGTMELLQGAQKASGRIQRLVDDLLILASAEAGEKTGDEVTICDMGEIVEEILADMQPLYSQQVEAFTEEALVEGEPELLYRAVGNIIGNAFKHTPPNARIEARVLADARTVIVTVDDSGPGLGEQPQALFKRFTRGNTQASGSGLGLPIAQAIIDTHQGHIRATSSPLGGARFEISLPRRG